MRVGTAQSFQAGRGTYIFEGAIHASVVGLKQEVPAPLGGGQPTIEVVQLRAKGQTIQPQVADTVICKVVKVNPRAANCLIVCVNGRALEQDFPAVIRAADVRATDVDTVEIYSCLRHKQAELLWFSASMTAASYLQPLQLPEALR